MQDDTYEKYHENLNKQRSNPADVIEQLKEESNIVIHSCPYIVSWLKATSISGNK